MCRRGGLDDERPGRAKGGGVRREEFLLGERPCECCPDFEMEDVSEQGWEGTVCLWSVVCVLASRVACR